MRFIVGIESRYICMQEETGYEKNIIIYTDWDH